MLFRYTSRCCARSGRIQMSLATCPTEVCNAALLLARFICLFLARKWAGRYESVSPRKCPYLWKVHLTSRQGSPNKGKCFGLGGQLSQNSIEEKIFASRDVTTVSFFHHRCTVQGAFHHWTSLVGALTAVVVPLMSTASGRKGLDVLCVGGSLS